MQPSRSLAVKRPTGMTAFIVVWLGQIASVLASSMSQFGLTIWMFEETGSALAMGMMQVAFITPFLLLSPIAGVMVDRYNRKLMMMVSDFAAIVATGSVFILLALGRLEVWQLYVAAALNGIGNTFQWPAYSAAITTMVPKEQYSRANGLMSLMEAGPGVLAPLLAGALLPLIGLAGILSIDVVTFFFAIGALLVVVVPQPVRTAAGQEAQGGLLHEAVYGFKYIFKRPSLLGLQMIFFFGNLFFGIAFTLLAPMVLASTGSNSVVFGAVQSAGAIGGVLGGVIMSTWSGFKRRVNGVLLGWIISSVGLMLVGAGQGLTIWLPAIFLTSLVSPLVNTSNQAIWQSKVAPDVQGRVFSARRLIAWFTNPISPIIAGAMADFVFEPAMSTDTALAAAFGPLVGAGPGAGMGLIMVLCGFLGLLVPVIAYFIPAIRNAETILPDHDQPAPAVA
ncbi:MAG TPA: MFS transporter [Anaerolineae bacterium]|nr:MFS transporter [Anaerolineae bacterium]HNU05444.1 MFS transporter [Anaerolineae bacterium]